MSATLAIRGLVKEYAPGRPVLQGVDLEFSGAGLSAIIGASGTGKSTLIRCINRLVEPSAGAILFGAVDLARLRGAALRRARRRIGMVFQEYNLVERLTVMENLLTGRLGYVGALDASLLPFPPAAPHRAYALLETVGLASLPASAPTPVGGQRQRRIACADAQPQLLADEPTLARPQDFRRDHDLAEGTGRRQRHR